MYNLQYSKRCKNYSLIGCFKRN